MKFVDLTGQRYGNLLVVKRVENGAGGYSRWLCKCDCGNYRILAQSQFKNKGTKFYCLRCIKPNRIKATIKGKVFACHGMYNSALHKKWADMKRRCTSPKTHGYKNYGGRGITICDEWLGEYGFINFYNWAILNGFQEGLSLDRIDVNGNYEPSNCRWVTNDIQANNRRTNRFIEYNGDSHTISEWSKITGINKNTILTRLRLGWGEEKVLNTKPNKYAVKDLGEAAIEE